MAGPASWALKALAPYRNETHDRSETHVSSPTDGGGQEENYTAGYTALKGFLAQVHVHLMARRRDRLEYWRLAALAGRPWRHVHALHPRVRGCQGGAAGRDRGG